VAGDLSTWQKRINSLGKKDKRGKQPKGGSEKVESRSFGEGKNKGQPSTP